MQLEVSFLQNTFNCGKSRLSIFEMPIDNDVFEESDGENSTGVLGDGIFAETSSESESDILFASDDEGCSTASTATSRRVSSMRSRAFCFLAVVPSCNEYREGQHQGIPVFSNMFMHSRGIQLRLQ